MSKSRAGREGPQSGSGGKLWKGEISNQGRIWVGRGELEKIPGGRGDVSLGREPSIAVIGP